MEFSAHYRFDRLQREIIIQSVGEGKIIKRVYQQGRNGMGGVVHSISDTGVITIQNFKTQVVVTRMLASPTQVKRMFAHQRIPKGLLELAKKYESLGYNNIKA